VGTHPEHHAWNQHHDKPRGRRKHGYDPKGLGAKASRSGVQNVPLILAFEAPANNFTDTIEGLHNIAASYAATNEVAKPRSTLESRG
jgi:hypothetical protein